METTATNAPVTIQAGNPGTLTLSASISVLGNPISFTAVAKVTPALLYSVPYAFGSETIVTANNVSTLTTGGTTSVVQAIASGTVSATTSAPTLTTNGPFT